MVIKWLGRPGNRTPQSESSVKKTISKKIKMIFVDFMYRFVVVIRHQKLEIRSFRQARLPQRRPLVAFTSAMTTVAPRCAKPTVAAYLPGARRRDGVGREVSPPPQNVRGAPEARRAACDHDHLACGVDATGHVRYGRGRLTGWRG